MSSSESSSSLFFSSSVRSSSGAISLLPSLVVRTVCIRSSCSRSSSSIISWILASYMDLKSSSKIGWSSNSSIVALWEPSIIRHFLTKSSWVGLMFLSKAVRLTSLIVSGLFIDSEARGTLMFSKRGFIRKATRCFFDSSWIGLLCSMSSAVSVSKISCSVCRSESPGKRGMPL